MRTPARRGSWIRKLAYPVVPMSGPLRPARTLGEAQRNLSERLPKEIGTRPVWIETAALITAAISSGKHADIRDATGQMMRALQSEGWLA